MVNTAFIITATLLLWGYTSAQTQSISLQDLLRKNFAQAAVNGMETSTATGVVAAAPMGCGYRGPGSALQSAVASFAEFPWMVAILREELLPASEPITLYHCGGALIAKTIVLTAAHCVHNQQAGSLLIRAGEWSSNDTSDHLPSEDRDVVQIIVHKQFNNKTAFNDVALLVLDSPLEWQRHIAPICLPPVNENFDNVRCFVTGWGTQEYKLRDYATILKKIEVPVVPHDRCQQTFRTTVLGEYFNLDSSFLCAGGEVNVDACRGDGGSPLVCPMGGNSQRYYLAGIVSWGLQCGTKSIPGVYANVTYMRNWLTSQLTILGVGSESFTP